MGNDLTTTEQVTDIAIRWSEPSLTPRLTELLVAKSIWEMGGEIPAVGGADRQSAERALAVYAEHPTGSSEAWIGKLLGTLATAFPAGKLSRQEADARLKVYVASLCDIDIDILRQAVAEVVKTCKFFPSVAEIREAAAKVPAPTRVVTVWRLRQLLRAPAPVEGPYIAPEHAAAIIDAAGLRLRETAKPDRPLGPATMPTAAALSEVALEVGIDRNGGDDRPPADITGLSITEIFRQRDYALGRDIPTE